MAVAKSPFKMVSR